ESLNEQEKSAEALIYLNQVRSRSLLGSNITTTDKEILRDIILHERRIEFAFENKRWHDLVRTGRAEAVMNAFGIKVKDNPQDYYYPEGSQPFPSSFQVSVDDYLYPIPENERTLNPELKQNPGYPGF
ncbi:MAG TPA: RagB/SusD family nutrient uptake outer membrane protein, partial [Arenibacter sp.]|nr:RagB/SusD family nutrient uptake outer membrane protein [Arenibacter sp.]